MTNPVRPSGRPARLQLKFRLRRSGWAKLTLVAGRRRLAIDVSWLQDSMNDLLQVVIGLLQDWNAGRVIFIYEPGSYECLLTRQEEELVVEVFDRPDTMWGSREHDPRSPRVFTARTDPRALACELVRELDRVYRQHGFTGYRHRWMKTDFPVSRYLVLVALLDRSNRRRALRSRLLAGRASPTDEIRYLQSRLGAGIETQAARGR